MNSLLSAMKIYCENKSEVNVQAALYCCVTKIISGNCATALTLLMVSVKPV